MIIMLICLHLIQLGVFSWISELVFLSTMEIGLWTFLLRRHRVHRVTVQSGFISPQNCTALPVPEIAISRER